MSCTELGFDDCGNLRVNKSADTEETLAFPASFDFTGYTGELQIRLTEGAASALLTVTEAATANGSIITFDGSNITLLIKAADLATLPNATVTDDPWVGVYQWVLTDPDGLTTQLVDGALVAEKGVVR
jgi:hypothetical protein